MKKVTVLGPAHPYRGGLASIMEIMARTFTARGAEVDIKTFTLQYPEFLFPGKTQYSDRPAPEDLTIERCVSTVNPFNWIKVGRRICRERPDVVLMKYWTPFMAPCFGTIARLARRNGHTKVLVQIDNVIPHEHHLIDRPCTAYFVNSVDGFVYMSQQVKDDLDQFTTTKPALFSPHPLFVNFGEAVSKEEACAKLGLDPEVEYSLFFGIIRDYKGLDLLLDTWAKLKADGQTANRKLIVAGEFYYNREKYIEQIERLGLKEDVLLHDYFVADDMVRYFFSAVDVLIQPYWSATQSGVTQIAYNFSLPMIVTNVGGLAEIVPDGKVGYVCDPTAEGVRDALERIFEGDRIAQFAHNMIEERKRFSWSTMCDEIEAVYRSLVE
jgi:glycosyltransferase involved in cell wall biosynthesis